MFHHNCRLTPGLYIYLTTSSKPWSTCPWIACIQYNQYPRLYLCFSPNKAHHKYIPVGLLPAPLYLSLIQLKLNMSKFPISMITIATQRVLASMTTPPPPIITRTNQCQWAKRKKLLSHHRGEKERKEE